MQGSQKVSVKLVQKLLAEIKSFEQEIGLLVMTPEL